MEQDLNTQIQAHQSLPLAARIEFIENRVEKLKIICDQLDPYSSIPDGLVEKLKEFQITDLYDPFKVTNKLLMLMEDSLEELQSLKNE